MIKFNIIKRSQNFLSRYTSKRKAYLIVYWSYFILTMIPLCMIGYFFNIIPYLTILTNTLLAYTYAFHQSNDKCMYLTTILIIIFGYLSKTIPLEWSFLIGLFCMRDIYLRSPLKLTVKVKGKKMEYRDEKYHRDRIMLILAICLLASVVGLYFNFIWYTNCIMMSIVMVDLTLFINRDEQ